MQEDHRHRILILLISISMRKTNKSHHSFRLILIERKLKTIKWETRIFAVDCTEPSASRITGDVGESSVIVSQYTTSFACCSRLATHITGRRMSSREHPWKWLRVEHKLGNRNYRSTQALYAVRIVCCSLLIAAFNSGFRRMFASDKYVSRRSCLPEEIVSGMEITTIWEMI